MTSSVPAATSFAYTGNGATTAFSFPLRFLENADVQVYLDGVLKTITTHYTLTGAGGPSGGTVTFVSAPASGVAIELRRSSLPKQTVDLSDSGRTPGDTLETQLDRLAMAGQDQSERIETIEAIADDLEDAVSDAEAAAATAAASAAAAATAETNAETAETNAETAETNAEAAAAVAVAAAAGVATRTALKALDTTLTARAYLTEAGREGEFLWRSGNYSTQIAADTTEGVFVKADAIASTVGAWVRVVDGGLDPRWFGAVGDGTTDDTTALQRTIDIAQITEWSILLPGKTFRTTAALTITAAIGIFGADHYTSTIKPEGNIFAFDISNIVGPVLRDFNVAWASAPASGAAFRVSAGTSQECGFLDAQNIRINNGWIGFYFVKASQWHLDRCVILDSGLCAVWVENQNNVDSGDSTIVNCQMTNVTKTGDVTGIIWRSSGGLRVVNNKINNFKYGVAIQLADGAATGDLLFCNNSIEAVGFPSVDSGFRISRLGATGTLHSVLLTGNQLNGWAAGIQVPLDAVGAWLNDLSMVGNVIWGNTGAASSGFLIASTTGFTIAANIMRSSVAGTIMITCGSSASDGYINGNVPQGSFSADSVASTSTFFYRKSGTTAALLGASGFLLDGGSGGMSHIVRTPSGQQGAFAFQTGTASRWLFGKDTTAEGGSNAGSGFFVNAYDDAGAFLFQPFSMTRATGMFRVNTQLSRNPPITKTADFTVGAAENWLINNKSGSTCVVTLPDAATYPGREIMIKTIQAQLTNSASSNVIPLGGGAAGTAILTANAGRWATLVSNGTNWEIMAGVV